MIVASTPKPWTGLINIIQRNAVRSWLRQGGDTEILLYGDDPGTKEACEEFGLTHVPDIQLTSYGTPNIGWIFRDLQSRSDLCTYINADIMLSNDQAFSAIRQCGAPFTATAARAGLIVTEEIQHWDYFYAAMRDFLKEQQPRCGVDIFIFTDLPPMPDFALGRGFWDKWFVAACTKQQVPFLDLTPKFWTIHQSHDYNHLPIKKKHAWDTRGFNWENGEGKGPETKINRRLCDGDFPPIALQQPYVKNCNHTPGKSFHLLSRCRAGTGKHRVGWPYICNELAHIANGGILLDDFVSQSFEWGEAQCHEKPWVGIFHHPVKIDSPLAMDRERELTKLHGAAWERSRKHLIGAIGLCTEVSNELHRWLGVPVTTIKYPRFNTMGKWSLQKLRAKGLRIVQPGNAHRDIRYIYHFPAPDPPWKLYRLLHDSPTVHKRDMLLPLGSNTVTELPEQSNEEYDELLNSSVIIQWMFGAAANNVVVECIEHGTPLIVNRLPAIEEYLGPDYPLYTDGTIPPHFWHASTLRKASGYLLSVKLPTVKEFVDQVDTFISGL